ncbi:caspase-3 [Patella vulgata]|uniref:caspase-3 n=1 Tax=Patella vulgata TaxID=6465 RepID=UPI00217FBCC1|nr:caspase-3 [Patella vulgata]
MATSDDTDVSIFKSCFKQVKEFVVGTEEDEASNMEIDQAEDDSTEYDFRHSRRGIAVVIVNEYFHGHSNRSGAGLDRDMLVECFKSLKFDVRVFTNLSGSDTMKVLQGVSREMCHDRDFDCFAFAMSTHGDKISYYDTHENKAIEEDIVHATDGYIRTADILDVFSDENCNGLEGKPRLFFLQACRGDKLDPGTESSVVKENYDEIDGYYNKEIITRLPCRKDFLVMYATPPGFFAFRRPQQGSWFVIHLCRILSQASSEMSNLCKLLRWVTKAVGHQFESSAANPTFDKKKQTPCIYSMLVKDIHLA